MQLFYAMELRDLGALAEQLGHVRWDEGSGHQRRHLGRRDAEACLEQTMEVARVLEAPPRGDATDPPAGGVAPGQLEEAALQTLIPQVALDPAVWPEQAVQAGA
jgi:hypothetical protein